MSVCLAFGGAVRLPAQAPGPAPQEKPAAPRGSTPLLRIIVLEGEGALNNITLQQGKDPSVRVEDDDARPIGNATVTFTLPAMGPSASFGDRGASLTELTDARGIATAHNLRPNNIAGQFQIHVTATHGGNRATAVINQTNAAPRRAVKKKNGKLAILIIALAGGGGAAAALALRGGGSSGQGPTGTVVVPGSPVFGPPR